MIRKLSMLFSIYIAISIGVHAAENAIDFSALKRTVNNELDEKYIPGAAVALIQGDRLIFSEGFGVANEKDQSPITADMLFQIGSMTKMMTAIVLATMAEEGKVNLNAPVGIYVQGLNPKIGQLTCHHLLAQISGIKDMPGEYGTDDEKELGKFIRSLKEDSILAAPETAFSYSNLNYAIAGLVIEEVAGKLYADVMSERLFSSLLAWIARCSAPQ